MNAESRIAKVRELPWSLWASQCASIVRIELRKNTATRRGFWVYLLAFAPVAIIGLHAMIDFHPGMQDDTLVFAGIFQFYYLRLSIFFGCLGIFMRLVRGEMVERCLHYYFLAPVRREVLVVGKFIAGWLTATWLFGVAIASSFMLIHLHSGLEYVFAGQGLRQMLTYVGISTLACLGYGAVFLALSMVFRNPIVPGIVFLGWEAINSALPSALQKLSITFYLRHLAPTEVSAQGVFALLTVVAEPVPVWAAISGVVLVSLMVLGYSCYCVRRLEISYTSD
jgi:ABC-type transport system involved in multi-copper enzyme maturation permease subunit